MTLSMLSGSSLSLATEMMANGEDDLRRHLGIYLMGKHVQGQRYWATQRKNSPGHYCLMDLADISRENEFIMLWKGCSTIRSLLFGPGKYPPAACSENVPSGPR